MVATDQEWASFFSGKYNFFIDGRLTGVADMAFGVVGNKVLRANIQSPFWNDKSGAYFTLRPGHTPIGMQNGGEIRGVFEHRQYKHIDYKMGCWELVRVPSGAWVVGFDPKGGPVATRFDGLTEFVNTDPDTGLPWKPKRFQIQFNSVTPKPRPDTNYPWNV